MPCRACMNRLVSLSELRSSSNFASSSLRAFSTRTSTSRFPIAISRSPSIHPAGSSAISPRNASPLRQYSSSNAGPSRSPTSPLRRLHLAYQSPTSARRTAATSSIIDSVKEMVMPPTRTPLTVTPPSLDAIREEGYLDEDVKLVDPEEAWLNITPEAVKHLEKITSKEPPEVLAKGLLALRVGVESGGCHGYQYIMEIVEERGTDDYVMQPEGVNCIPVIIDLVSLGLLKGATLHHATELIGSSFRLQDNPQAKEGGNCGCGVSWELK